MSSVHNAESNLLDLDTYRVREYTALVERLREAEERLAEGPEILFLINELVAVAEDTLNGFSGMDDRDEPVFSCPAAARFMHKLIAYADAIRNSGGAFPTGFINFIRNIPVDARCRAA